MLEEEKSWAALKERDRDIGRDGKCDSGRYLFRKTMLNLG